MYVTASVVLFCQLRICCRENGPLPLCRTFLRGLGILFNVRPAVENSYWCLFRKPKPPSNFSASERIGGDFVLWRTLL